MPNVIDSFLRKYRQNNYQSDENINIFFSKNDLYTTYSSPELFFDKIHVEVLKMFNDYEIFETALDLSAEKIGKKNWQLGLSHEVFANITNNSYKIGSRETSVRRGLIQIYLYNFGNRYIGYTDFRYQDITNDYLFSNNTNTLQKDRELVFKELLERLFPEEKSSNNELLIERKNDINQVITFLQDSKHVMLIGPSGIGKSTFLKIFQNKLNSSWNIFLFYFDNNVSLYQEEYFCNRFITEFNNRLYPNRKKSLLLLLDDIHFLPNKLLESLFSKIIPEIKNLYNENAVEIKILTTSALELDYHFQNSNDYFYVPYFLKEFSKLELGEFLNKNQEKFQFSLEDLYTETLGYPIFVNQVLAQGKIVKNVDWYTLIINSLSWDPDIQEFLNAMCTFRFISPFFLLEFSKFVGNNNILKETWGISDQILDFSESKEYWNMILHMHSFISRITIDIKNFNKNKNFRISRILRKLVERYIKNSNRFLFELRHQYASNYYKDLLITQNAPLKNKPFYITEFIFHLTKLELSNEELIGNITNIYQSISKYSSKSDLFSFIEVFGNNLHLDEELIEELGLSVIEQITNEIRTINGDENG